MVEYLPKSVTAGLLASTVLLLCSASGTAGPLEPVTYPLDTSQGFVVIREFSLAGIAFSAAVDTGVNDMTLPERVFDSIGVADLDIKDVYDFAGSKHQYEYGYARLESPFRRNSRRYEVSLGNPDELGISEGIVPLDYFDSDIVLFALSRNELVLFDLDAAGDAGAQVAQSTGASGMRILPYWRNPEGYFVGLEIDHQYYFALLDTGANYSSFNEHFIARYAAYFRQSELSAETSGVHGGATYEQRFWELLPGVKLLGINQLNDLPLAGEFAADPTLTKGGNAAPESVTGGFGSAYEHGGGAPWPPVATIGMDVLGRYFDFLFDTRQHYLVLWPREETPLLFPAME
jgi:hypothetical protein